MFLCTWFGGNVRALRATQSLFRSALIENVCGKRMFILSDYR